MMSKAVEAEPDGEAQEAAVGLAPSRDQLGSLVNRDLDGHEHAGVCALHQDGHGGVDNHTSFCGGRMERLYACACHLEDISVAAPSKVTHVHTEHLHKQRRKEKSRKKWQSHKKASGRESSNCDHCGDSSVFRGKDAADSMMTELQTFYGEHAKLHDPETAKVYESIASSVSREALGFKHAAADVAVPEPHHSGLTGHGMLIEFCTSRDSMMRKVGKDLGVQVIRCTETHMNVEHDSAI